MSKISWFFSMCGNYSVVSTPRVTFQMMKTGRDSCFQKKEGPRVPPQGQYMRQHGKIWKNTSKKSFRTMFSDEFFRFFPEAPRPSQGKIQRFLKVFWYPGAPGTIPEWSWINWKTSFFHKKSQKNEPEKFQEWKNENSQYPTKLRFEQAIRCSFSWETRWWSQISNWFPKFHKC